MSEISVKYEVRDVCCIEYDALECIQEDFKSVMKDLVWSKVRLKGFSPCL